MPNFLGEPAAVPCGLVAPFAWVMGNRVVAEIDASGGRVGGRSTANAGRILGIVGSLVLIAGLVFGVLIVILALIPIATSP